jgi:hypothetical protein
MCLVWLSEQTGNVSLYGKTDGFYKEEAARLLHGKN